MIATRFIHLGFLTLIPLEGLLVVSRTDLGEETVPHSLYGRSVVAGLTRFPLSLMVVGWGFFFAREAFSSRPVPEGIHYFLGLYLLVLLVWIRVTFFYDAKRQVAAQESRGEEAGP